MRGQPAEARQATRRIKSLPLVEAMKVWLETELKRVPPRQVLEGSPEARRPFFFFNAPLVPGQRQAVIGSPKARPARPDQRYQSYSRQNL
jgi:hypothetical protein